MSDTYKTISRRFFVEAWGAGQFDVLERYVAPTYRSESASPNGLAGAARMKQQIVRWRTAFPDLQVTVVEQLAEGNKVMTRWLATGTQQQMLDGMPPDGQLVRWHCVTLHRFVDDQVVEASTFTSGQALAAKLAALTLEWGRAL